MRGALWRRAAKRGDSSAGPAVQGAAAGCAGGLPAALLATILSFAGLPLTALTIGATWTLGSVERAAAQSAAPPSQLLELARFGQVRLFRPPASLSSAQSNGFVIFLQGGPVSELPSSAVFALLSAGYVTAVVDGARYLKTLQDEEDGCLFIGGEFERLGQVLQQQARTRQYRLPILAGSGLGGALAYVVGVQAPKGFLGAFALDFCPELPMAGEFCEDADPPRSRIDPSRISFRPAADVPLPWDFIASPSCHIDPKPFEAIRRSGGQNPGSSPEERLVAAINQFSSAAPSTVAPAADLPVVELPAAEQGKNFFVIFYSGDGGWAGIDSDLGDYLNKKGISVAGLDSLRYFWRRRTIEESAEALQRMISQYRAKWVKRKLALIGYSFGAGILPVLMNRLPAEDRAAVSHLILLSPDDEADPEIHLTDWLGIESEGTGLPVKPELDKLKGTRILCLWGSDETDSFCPTLPPDLAVVESLPGDHHFDGDYEKAADIILRFLGK